MNEQDKEAFEKWYDSSLGTHIETWQAALKYRDNGLDERFAKTYLEGMKTGELKERERSKKLVVHLEILIEVLADDCRSDEDCDHCWAVLALEEYRGEK